MGYQFSTNDSLTTTSSGWTTINATTAQIEATHTASANDTYWFYVKDSVGNMTKQSIVVDNIDTDGPEINSLVRSTDEPTNAAVILTGKAIDAQSGIVAYQFSTNGSLTTTSSGWTTIDVTKTEVEVKYSATSNNTYWFYVKDSAGNVSKQSIVVDNIDTNKPTLQSINVI